MIVEIFETIFKYGMYVMVAILGILALAVVCRMLWILFSAAMNMPIEVAKQRNVSEDGMKAVKFLAYLMLPTFFLSLWLAFIKTVRGNPGPLGLGGIARPPFAFVGL